jgi:hypothetical protein
MASKNVIIGTGAALAGLSGLAVAAVTSDQPDAKPTAARPAAPVVETQTVIIRKVEHRVIHLKPKHHAVRGAATASVARAAAPIQATPVIQAAPVPVVRTTTPVRTRTSGGHSTTPTSTPIRTRTSGGGSGHESETSDHAEHADD